MKRSEVNDHLRDAKRLLDEYNFLLPPFAFWSPEEWAEKGSEYDEIRDNMLGWYLTDFGLGDYAEQGLIMFTLRNGNPNMDKYIKPYAEKILICQEEQETVTHFHWNKMEDIINRGGGNLIIEVHNSTDEEELADTDVTVNLDGEVRTVEAGTRLRLEPGESITVTPGMYHAFWGEKGEGPVLVGEVSKVNDDTSDNNWYDDEVDLFMEFEEDEEPLHLLCTEYPEA